MRFRNILGWILGILFFLVGFPLLVDHIICDVFGYKGDFSFALFYRQGLMRLVAIGILGIGAFYLRPIIAG